MAYQPFLDPRTWPIIVGAATDDCEGGLDDMLMTFRWLAAMIPRRRSGVAPDAGRSLDRAFRVLPSDLDLLMHMTNGRYLSILDAARISYLNETGLWRQLRSRRWHPVVAAQTITYRRPLTLGVRYVVRTTLLGFDARNCYYEQVFRVSSDVYASAVVAVRFLDRAGTSVDPESIRTLDATFDMPENLPDWVKQWAVSARSQVPPKSTIAGAKR